jgi:hypothetical protein
LKPHDAGHLVEIAVAQFADRPDEVRKVCEEVGPAFQRLTEQAISAGSRAPSTAEYLDAVRARLHTAGNTDVTWADIESFTLAKSPPAEG